ncbi:MAG TPA: hypothetical protein VEG33_06475 [Streptosporangiaceae bacterium]|nr:hypothetical protein [Streptosporangiaceae bacterium]
MSRSIASTILATSPGSHTDGILACLLERAAGTATRQAASTRPSAEANRRNDRTAHSFCSTVLNWYPVSVATNAPIVAASQEASPPRVPVNATNSPASVP